MVYWEINNCKDVIFRKEIDMNNENISCNQLKVTNLLVFYYKKTIVINEKYNSIKWIQHI